MAVTNEQGQVAVRYYQPIPKLVELGNGHSYYFDVKFSVSMAWVDAEDVQTLFNTLGGCCGGQRQVFFHASQDNVNFWVYGNREGVIQNG